MLYNTPSQLCNPRSCPLSSTLLFSFLLLLSLTLIILQHYIEVSHSDLQQWERLEDLKGYFFKSGFNDPNPEDYVYSFFEPYVGIKLTNQVCKCLVGLCHYILHMYNSHQIYLH